MFVQIPDFGLQREGRYVAGDGLLALFGSSNDALNFATEVQRSFHEQAVWSDGDPMKFRIALSRGEISVKQGNVHGHCVNVAAPLQTLAAPGDIVLTGDVGEALEPARRPVLVPIGATDPQKHQRLGRGLFGCNGSSPVP
jgi:adenylate cyclase